MSTVSDAKLRTLVVEDEWAARDYLVELLDGSNLAQVAGAVSSAEEARQILLGEGRHAFDVVFLDVRLSGGRNEGLDVARELAALPGAPLLVLATAFHTHALEAYDLGVSDYLLKPFTEQRVEQCLKRLRARDPRPERAGPLRIAARRNKGLVLFDRDEVWAFEAAERLTQVHTSHGAFDIDLSLAAIESSFGRSFARVHRNWLINVAHVKELTREGETRVWVGDGLAAHGRGVHVPVARERAQQVLDLLLANTAGLRRGNEPTRSRHGEEVTPGTRGARGRWRRS
ncbi:LytR/AlgR family response regulator transcription factor [Sorangium sp. So ce128]|uniref:LytR/AlgR family response regulator transcription factor n=1 Tax=Sorangium sp. So ce128 TaxID=3133281 RepID=UPI003F5D73C9